MRKVITFLAAALTLAWLIPASAQAQAPDMFKDLDTSHWAYQAVENLRSKNIVWGYPDGYFRGKRTLTRYEFAVALDRALKSITGGPGGVGPKGDKGDTGDKGEKGDTGERGGIGPPGMTPEEVDQFRRLMKEFRDELASMGNTVQGIKRALDLLNSRVDALTKRIDAMPVIYGGAFVGIRSDRAHGGYVDYNGNVFGVGTAAGSGLVNTPVALHQFVLGVKANIAGGATLDAALTSNNTKNFYGGNIAQIGSLVTTPAADTYIHHLEIVTPFTGLGRGSKLTIGRFGERLGHLTLWKPDTDRYLANPFEDDGYYHMDGLRLDTNFGSVNVSAFGAQTKSVTGTNGGPWNSPLAGVSTTGGLGFDIFTPGVGSSIMKPFAQPFLGQMTVDQIAGITLGMGFNVMQGGHVRFTALDTSAELSGSPGIPGFPGFPGIPGTPGSRGVGFNNVLVLGADFDLKVADRITVTGEWSKTNTGTSRFHTVNPHENNAIDGRVGYNSGGLNVTAGYRYIDPLFYAPGYWGRIGNWLNPTNIQGPTFRAGYDFTPGFGVNLGGDFYTAARNRAGSQGGLSHDDDIHRLLVGLRWDVAKNFRTTIDWEGVFWKLEGAHAGISPGGDGVVHPTEQYLTLGTGYNLTSNTLLKFNYTVGDFNGHKYLSSPAGSRYNFNTFTTQVAVKF